MLYVLSSVSPFSSFFFFLSFFLFLRRPVQHFLFKKANAKARENHPIHSNVFFFKMFPHPTHRFGLPLDRHDPLGPPISALSKLLKVWHTGTVLLCFHLLCHELLSLYHFKFPRGTVDRRLATALAFKLKFDLQLLNVFSLFNDRDH